jgi:hypothetical protein
VVAVEVVPVPVAPAVSPGGGVPGPLPVGAPVVPFVEAVMPYPAVPVVLAVLGPPRRGAVFDGRPPVAGLCSPVSLSAIGAPPTGPAAPWRPVSPPSEVPPWPPVQPKTAKPSAVTAAMYNQVPFLLMRLSVPNV